MVASRVRARVIVRNANLGITEKSDRDTLKMDSAEATVNHVVPVCRFVLQTERTLENIPARISTRVQFALMGIADTIR